MQTSPVGDVTHGVEFGVNAAPGDDYSISKRSLR